MEATCFISGKEYIPIDLLLIRENAEVLKYACKKYDIIEKEIKQVDRGSLFRKPFAIVSVYVPLSMYKEFNKSIEDKVTGEKEKSKLSKDKDVLVMFVVIIVSLVAAAFALRKITAKFESEKKPNAFQRFKMWWNKKFSKKEDKPTAEPELPAAATSETFTKEEE